MSNEAAAFLREVDAQRRRARQDRRGYWLPLLLLGLLILAAPLVYGGGASAARVDFPPLAAFGPTGRAAGNPTAVALYWLGVVVLGLLTTVAWYRWRGNRVGVETSTRAVLLAGAAGLVLLLVIVPFVTQALLWPLNTVKAVFWLGAALFAVAAAAVTVALWAPRSGRLPVWRVVVAAVASVVALLSADVLFFFTTTHGFAPLLVLGIALLALAAVERSVLCAAVSVLFTLAALLANLYDMENMASRVGLRVDITDASAVALANLVLPAAVLITGGLVAALLARRTAR